MNKHKIKLKVLETLQRYRSLEKELYLPVPIKALIKSLCNVRVIPYSRYMRDFNLSLDEMRIYAKTNDAYTDYISEYGLYTIVYNDLDESIMKSNRYRWNLAHELGHIVLGHHIDGRTRLFRNVLSTLEYAQYEEEADWFAAYILVPHVILNEMLDIISQYELQQRCRISIYASQFRFQYFKKWIKNNTIYDEYDRQLLQLYSHKKICMVCFSELDDDFRYCLICGKENSKLYYKYLPRKEKIMKYKKLKPETGRLYVCYVCGNEELAQESLYCHICGSPVVNRCLYEDSSNGGYQCDMADNHPIPTNARFCPYCSSPTVFKKLLDDWETEKALIESGALDWDSEIGDIKETPF